MNINEARAALDWIADRAWEAERVTHLLELCDDLADSLALCLPEGRHKTRTIHTNSAIADTARLRLARWEGLRK